MYTHVSKCKYNKIKFLKMPSCFISSKVVIHLNEEIKTFRDKDNLKLSSISSKAALQEILSRRIHTAAEEK
jgi:hypothetical protein